MVLSDKEDALYERAKELCPVKLDSIVEILDGDGRKRWGQVTNIHGNVSLIHVGWAISGINCRKNGCWIGGRFHFSDRAKKTWRVIA